MEGVITFLNSAGKSFVDFAVVMLVQSSLLIIVLLGLELILRKRVRAVLRYWLWMLILVKLMLPTTLSSPTGLAYWIGDKLPGILQQKSSTGEESGITSAGLELLEVIPIREVRVFASPTSGINPPPEAVSFVEAGAAGGLSITWQAVVFLTWLAAVITMTLLLIQRMFFVRGLVAQSKNPSEPMVDLLERCREQLGVRRAVRLKLSPVTASPSICGLFRPTILVPQTLSEKLNARQLKSILLHELAHIKRRDLLVSFVQTVLQIIYIYNPLLWVANAIIRKIREEAVDEMVLVAMGEQAEDYPETLLSVSKLAFSRPALSLRLIGVAESRKALISRIEYIASRPFPKKAKIGITGLIAVVIIAAILLPMAKAEKMDAEAEIDETWGEVVEGVQMRVRPERQTWYEGQTPRFLVDMRNNGTVELELGLTQEHWEVELDGLWYRVGSVYSGVFSTLIFGPGEVHKDIEFYPGEWSEWNINGKALEFTPGWHTVRLAFGPSTRDRAHWRRLRVVSNTLVIEVLPTGEKADNVGTKGDAATTLQAELYEVWRQRDRDLAGAEASGLQLLKKYEKPEEQALIYYQLAEIYAQSGQISPSKTVEYAEAGWWYLHDPVKKARLFVFWGDALQLSKGRREVARIYLRGLKFCLRFGLPGEKPELPAVSAHTVDGPPEMVEEYRRRNHIEMAAWKHAKRTRELIEHRQALTGQIVQLYAREPDAFDELRELVMKYLHSEEAAEVLIAAAMAYRRNPKVGIPVITRMGPDPNPDADLHWGQAAEGIRVRLRTDTRLWAAGDVPKFKLDVRNDGSRILLLTSAPDCWGIEVDGVWYKAAIPMLGGAKGMSFGPDKRWYDLLLSLDMALGGRSKNGGLELTPGRHTVRATLAKAPSGDGVTVPVRAVSNPVEIEIVSDEETKKSGSDVIADVYKQLDQIVELSGWKPQMSFGDALEELKNSVEPPLRIVVLWKDLAENADIEQSTQINIGPLPPVRLSMALELLLKSVSGGKVELGYIVEDGVITIATVDSLPNRLETRVYDIALLVGPPLLAGYGGGFYGQYGGHKASAEDVARKAARPNELAKLIQETIEPDSWCGASGEGEIHIYDNRKLIVYQTREVHEKIEKLLGNMRRPGLGEAGIPYPKEFSYPVPWWQAVRAGEPNSAVQIESRFILVAPDANEIGELLEEVEGFEIAPLVAEPNLRHYLLNDGQRGRLLKLIKGDPNCGMTLTAPRVTVLSGESAALSIQTQTVIAPPPQVSGQILPGMIGPGTAETIPTGTTLTITPIISADKKDILLNLNVRMNNFLGMKGYIFETPLADGTVAEYEQELPQIETVSLQTRVSIPDGATLLLAGQKVKSKGEQDGEIVEKDLLILVKAEIVDVDPNDAGALGFMRYGGYGGAYDPGRYGGYGPYGGRYGGYGGHRPYGGYGGSYGPRHYGDYGGYGGGYGTYGGSARYRAGYGGHYGGGSGGGYGGGFGAYPAVPPVIIKEPNSPDGNSPAPGASRRR